MPDISKKKLIVEEIQKKLEKAKSLVLVDSRGLKVSEDTLLRKTLRDGGVDYKVYKNTMLRFAFKDTPFEGLSKFLEGPTTAAFSYEDATAAASIINKHIKDMPNLEFKAGLFEGTVYDASGVAKIAAIPLREVLLSRVLGSLQSPISALARVIKALKEKKEENN